MRVLLAISTLGPGGAERVIVILADALARRGHAVSLLTLEAQAADFHHPSSAVQRLALGLYGAAKSWPGRMLANVRRVYAIRRELRSVHPDVVVSFITEMNVLMLIACTGLRIAVLVSERVDPRAHPLGRGWIWLRHVLYRRGSGLVVQTNSVAEWFRRSHRGLPSIAVIPNPVLPPAPPAEAPDTARRQYLFAAGRLAYQKGFDVLLRALALLIGEGGDFDLVIAGAGPQEQALRQLADELGISLRVRFLGRIRELSGWLAGCFAFVLPSRYEGFPNVLLEALAAGAAAIATDCSSGPREILEDGKYGILVPCEDPRAVAASVRALRNDPALLSRLRRNGPSVLDRFGIDAIASSWESEIARAARS